MRMTEEQLDLEARDKSQTIPWSEHWERMAASLKKLGYKRTNDACRDKWKRIIESQESDAEDSAQEVDDGATNEDTALSVAAQPNDSSPNKRNIGSEKSPTQPAKKMRTEGMLDKEAIKENHVS